MLRRVSGRKQFMQLVCESNGIIILLASLSLAGWLARTPGTEIQFISVEMFIYAHNEIEVNERPEKPEDSILMQYYVSYLSYMNHLLS
jgi:hypothetical protein